MAYQVLTATLNIKNYLFDVEGESFTGTYRISVSESTNHLAMNGFVATEALFTKKLFFRNTLLRNYDIKLSETETISKKFQKDKEKLEKIFKFTTSK